MKRSKTAYTPGLATVRQHFLHRLLVCALLCTTLAALICPPHSGVKPWLLSDFALIVQHSSVAEGIGKPHPSYSPEEKARSREISPTYSTDASNACTPRKGGHPAISLRSLRAFLREA